MSDFLSRFVKDRKVREDTSTKFAISHDKWDKRTADQISSEVRDYVLAEQELARKVDTGYEAMNDTLFALFKANPHLKDVNSLRPSYTINHRVIQEMMGLKEYEKGRNLSIGDPIGAGLACASIEPHLEVLFDKLQDAQDIAKNMEDLLQSIEDYSDNIEQLMEDALNAESDEDKERLENARADQQQQLDELIKAMQKGESDLHQELEERNSDIRMHMKQAMEDANGKAEALDQFNSWGMNPGGISRMNPEARLALAKKLQTQKFKAMAEIIGRMQSIAVSEQLDRADYASDEIYDLEKGADLARVIPPEMLALNDDDLMLDWLHRYVERSLIQYSLRGNDTVVKGGIILLEDGSSSMSGPREVWSKAIGLALLKVAIMQKRPFYAVNFSGPGSYMTFDFDTSKENFDMVKTVGKKKTTYVGVEAVMEFAECSMYGGTDFMTPLSVAMDRLQDQFNKTGATEGDIVLLTDGECLVPNSFIKEFKDNQHKLEFKVFGIAIQTNPDSEPLNTICDSNCIGLKELTDPSQLKPLFSRI